MSRFGLRRLPKRTGTGLAYANRKAPEVAKYSSSGIRMVPMGSMCLSGLRVTRPSTKAVLSPKVPGHVAMRGLVDGDGEQYRQRVKGDGLNQVWISIRLLSQSEACK